VIGHHPHVLHSNQSATYAAGLAPDKTTEPRDEIVAKFSVVKKDYGSAGIRFELADVGVMPPWCENNRLLLRSGRAQEPFIHPVFIDREVPRLLHA
jgi:hypothetical protein